VKPMTMVGVRAALYRERKEIIEARNEADTLAYSVEKSLTEYKVIT